jgi:acetyl-CoA decarbonylase/synthase complex subunit gamma
MDHGMNQYIAEMTTDPMKEAVIASMFVAKYGGVIVLSDFRGESLFPLLVERMNIYTDPHARLPPRKAYMKLTTPKKIHPSLSHLTSPLPISSSAEKLKTAKFPHGSW